MVTKSEYHAAVKRMRAAQKYRDDHGRKRADIIVAKAAEADVDRLIAAIDARQPIENGGGVQEEMFTTGGRS